MTVQDVLSMERDADFLHQGEQKQVRSTHPPTHLPTRPPSLQIKPAFLLLLTHAVARQQFIQPTHPPTHPNKNTWWLTYEAHKPSFSTA